MVLTFATAAVTVAAMIVVIAVPALMDCADSPDGLATCMRDKVAGIGLLPPREIAQVPAAQTDVDTAAPEPDGTPAAIPPQISMLRVEPDGSVVIAGSGEPGAELTVLANGEPLGAVTPERSGDWALIPEVPLPGGETAVTLISPDGASDARSFLVTVDQQKLAPARIIMRLPDGSEELLAGDPPAGNAGPPASELPPLGDDASALDTGVQAPEVPAPQSAPESGDAHAAVDFGSTLVAEVPPPPVRAVPPEAPSPAEAATERSVALPFAATIVAEVPAPAPADRGIGVAVAAAEPVLRGEPDPWPARVFGVIAEVPSPAALEGPVDKADAPAVPAGPPPAPQLGRQALAADEVFSLVPQVPVPRRTTGAASQQVAGPPAPPAIGVPGVAATPPTIEAVEIDRDVTLIAGTGENNASVTVFFDDQPVGHSPIENGFWLVETDGIDVTSNLRIRVESTAPNGARASTEMDLVGSAPPPVDAAVAPSPVAPEWDAEVAAEVPAISRPAPDITRPGPVLPADSPATAPRGPDAAEVAETPAAPLVYPPTGVVTNRQPAIIPEVPQPGAMALVPEAMAPELGTPSVADVAVLEDERTTEDAPGPRDTVRFTPVAGLSLPHAGTTDQLPPPGTAAPDDQVAPKPLAVAPVPTIRAISAHEAGPSRFASGKAIIRRGDTLWDISRRVYGDGSKYQTLYRANRDRIPRPGKIRPGQVLDVPLVYDN